jgi:Tfp pilus assembly protein PilF
MVSIKPLNRKKTLIHLSLIVMLTFLAYIPIFQADFAGYDDSLYVTGNDWVLCGLTFQSISWAFTHFHSANWHPLTWLSHMLDCEIYGLNATGHHLTNLIFHISNSIFIYLFFVIATGARYRSLAVALFFALHPLHVESVAWISERKDVLSTFWGLLCILAYYRYVKTLERRHYCLMIFLFCLSLMSKPMLVTMPVLLIILDIWPLQRKDSKRFWDKLLMFVPVIASSIVTYIAQLKDDAVNPISSLSLSSRVLNAMISSVQYLSKTILPIHQSVLYPHPGNTISMVNGIICTLVLIGLLILSIRQFKKMPFILTGYIWFFIALSPVIGIIQVGSQSMAERYTYIPHIGLFWAFIWMMGYLAKNYYLKVCFVLFVCSAIIGFGVKTSFQTFFWKNGQTLFTQAIANTTNNYIAHNNLGVCLFQNNHVKEALEHLNKSIAIEPDCLEARLNKAECLLLLHKNQEAIREFQYVLTKSPEDEKAHLGLAEHYRKKQRYQIAIDHCQKALTKASARWPLYVKLADIYEDMDELNKSAYYYQQALTEHYISPIIHYHYARVLVASQKYIEAIYHFKKAIDFDPDFAKAYNSLGALYAWNNQIKKAFKFISIAHQLAPDDEEIINNYKKIQERWKSSKEY